MKVVVTLVENENLKEFNLPQDALISDLKVAVAAEEGVDDPINRVRMYFKTASGDALGKLLLNYYGKNFRKIKKKNFSNKFHDFFVAIFFSDFFFFFVLL